MRPHRRPRHSGADICPLSTIRPHHGNQSSNSHLTPPVLFRFPAAHQLSDIGHAWKQGVSQAFLDFFEVFSRLISTIERTDALSQKLTSSTGRLYACNIDAWTAMFSVHGDRPRHDMLNGSSDPMRCDVNCALDAVLHHNWAGLVDSPHLVPGIKRLYARTALAVIFWCYAAGQSDHSRRTHQPQDAKTSLLKVVASRGAFAFGLFRLRMKDIFGIGEIDDDARYIILSLNDRLDYRDYMAQLSRGDPGQRSSGFSVPGAIETTHDITSLPGDTARVNTGLLADPFDESYLRSNVDCMFEPGSHQIEVDDDEESEQTDYPGHSMDPMRMLEMAGLAITALDCEMLLASLEI